ncbi:hypothetical protein AB0J25_07175 [Streptomyces sp. NPDC049910]|uniref:hypothetical protein n=1 Tax=Streptomyces sp. NPDC049910 TaxID=3155278 RepID=UPI003435EB10
MACGDETARFRAPPDCLPRHREDREAYGGFARPRPERSDPALGRADPIAGGDRPVPNIAGDRGLTGGGP